MNVKSALAFTLESVDQSCRVIAAFKSTNTGTERYEKSAKIVNLCAFLYDTLYRCSTWFSRLTSIVLDNYYAHAGRL